MTRARPAPDVCVSRLRIELDRLGEIAQCQLPRIREKMGPASVLIDFRVGPFFESARVVIDGVGELAQPHPCLSRARNVSAPGLLSRCQKAIQRRLCVFESLQSQKRPATEFLPRCGVRIQSQRGLTRPEGLSGVAITQQVAGTLDMIADDDVGRRIQLERGRHCRLGLGELLLRQMNLGQVHIGVVLIGLQGLGRRGSRQRRGPIRGG